MQAKNFKPLMEFLLGLIMYAISSVTIPGQDINTQRLGVTILVIYSGWQFSKSYYLKKTAEAEKEKVMRLALNHAAGLFLFTAVAWAGLTIYMVITFM